MRYPEQQAREIIDRMLQGAGWFIQDYHSIDLSAGQGIAIREFPLETVDSDSQMEYIFIWDIF